MGLLLEGPLCVAAVLLLAAGVGKAAEPTSASQALRTARVWHHPALVRALGAGEVFVALLVLARGGRLAATLLAATYLAFAAFLVRLRRVAGTKASCGCLGGRAAPLSGLHIAVNLLLAAWAGAAAVFPVGSAPEILREQPWAGVPAMALVLLASALIRLLFTAFPDLHPGSRDAAVIGG